MNLFARFVALKEKVGGNREKRKFEYSMGETIPERYNITEPSRAIIRVLGQIQFALQLNTARENIYEAEISAALDVLEACMDAEGVLTRTSCLAAEEKLLPLQADAEQYEILYVSHAHIDMNWMWGWQETVAITLSTFRTMLNLMKEYPDFTFSQSQASVYKIVEDHDPEMMEEIRARIAEGRWEVTANAWVETDKNMPDTESLIRHIQVTRDYLEKIWGIEPGSIKVDFSPDTFGHSRFVPEINTFGSVPYYYHCRGMKSDLTLYRYRAPSGSEVLMYKEPYWYNSSPIPDNGAGVLEMERRCGGLRTALIVYGVGDHGGGPTRRDIENILEMQNWPVFPKVRFGTLHRFFQRAEAVRENLPVVDHELNVVFSGCYSTQSRIKLANRRAEAALLDSERMSALSSCVLGTPFAAERYDKAWQSVLFTHFHDILTGSCMQESREHAMGKYAEAIAYAQTEQSKACEKLSQNVDTSMFPSDDCIDRTMSEGAGAGFGIQAYAGVPNPERCAGKTRIYTVFNASAQPRRELAEVTLWDYTGDMTRLQVVDHEGKSVPFQIRDPEPLKFWDHRFSRLLIEADVPPMGYAVYAVQEKELTDYPAYTQIQDREEFPHNDIILENSRIRARFDTGSGQLHSLVNKATGEELLSAPAGLNLVRVQHDSMSAWRIGRYIDITPVTETSRVRFREGKLRNTVVFDQKVMHSTVFMTISLDEDSDVLRYEFEIDWHETFSAQDLTPVLSYRLPLRSGAKNILTDVPAGCAARPACQMDVPALTGACAETDGTTAALITDCKYGYRLADDVLSVTLIHTAGNPDPYPERGVHAIKLFVALTDGKHTALKRRAEALIRPLSAVSTASHPGKLPPRSALMTFDAEHVVMTGAFMEGKALVVRCYEADGDPEKVSVTVPFEPSRAVLTDLIGAETGNAEVSGNKVIFDVGAYRIAQVKIYR